MFSGVPTAAGKATGARQGRGEHGRKIWENGIETCKISCMKRVASPGSMRDTGCLGLVHWDDLEGWYREGGGRRVQDGEHMYTCGRFILMFGTLRTMHGGGSAPSCCAFTHRVAFEEGSGSEFSTVHCDPHSQRLWHSQ